MAVPVGAFAVNPFPQLAAFVRSELAGVDLLIPVEKAAQLQPPAAVRHFHTREIDALSHPLVELGPAALWSAGRVRLQAKLADKLLEAPGQVRQIFKRMAGLFGAAG